MSKVASFLFATVPVIQIGMPCSCNPYTFDAWVTVYHPSDLVLTACHASNMQVRKLEFLLAEAVAQGHDCVITIGGIQSNHCRATAVAARCVSCSTAETTLLILLWCTLSDHAVDVIMVSAQEHVDRMAHHDISKLFTLLWVLPS